MDHVPGRVADGEGTRDAGRIVPDQIVIGVRHLVDHGDIVACASVGQRRDIPGELCRRISMRSLSDRGLDRVLV